MAVAVAAIRRAVWRAGVRRRERAWHAEAAGQLGQVFPDRLLAQVGQAGPGSGHELDAA